MVNPVKIPKFNECWQKEDHKEINGGMVHSYRTIQLLEESDKKELFTDK